DRKWATYDLDPGYVRPFGFVNTGRELYQHNEKWVWVWEELKTEEDHKKELQELLDRERAEDTKGNSAQLAYLESMQPEFATLELSDARKTIRFEESSQGLADGGSWRKS